MKKIEFATFGGPDVLRVVECERPVATRGQVTIDVTHAGVGLVDALLRSGLLPLPLPFTPGLEVAGHIAAIGPDVTGFEVGEPVVALLLLNFGGYATTVAAPAISVIRLRGKGVDHETAAASIVNFTTAFILLSQIAPVDPSSRILIHGASGGLGTACVKLARALGATDIVATTSSAAKERYLRQIGAATVLLTSQLLEKPDGVATRRGYNIIVDPVGGEVRRQSLGLLERRGKLLVVGGAEKTADILLSSTAIWLNNAEVLGVNIGAMSAAQPERVAAAARVVVEMLGTAQFDAGAIEVIPFANAAEAHRLLEAKRVVGKLVLAT
jgi:NADPH2:quinone reductase